MSIPLFDLKRLVNPRKEEFSQAFNRCLEHSYFIGGPEVSELEECLQEYLRINHVIGVSSGTDALIASLMSLGLKSDDDVLVTSFTFVSSATSILLAGLNPVFVDTAPESFHPSLEEIKKAKTSKTKALIYVHLFGEPNELVEIKKYCDEEGIVLIEDCAQSFGSRFDDGSHVGTVGDMSCFSFFPAKNLGCFGDGGAVITNDEEHKNKIMMIRNHGSKVRYYNDILGSNFRLDTIQAAMLLLLLENIDEWIESRKLNAATYLREIKSPDIKMPPTKKNHSWNQFTIRVDNRNELKKYLDSLGIGNAVYYPVPNHQQKVFSNIISKEDITKFPNTDKLSKEVLSLPIYPGLTAEEQEQIVKALNNFYGK